LCTETLTKNTVKEFNLRRKLTHIVDTVHGSAATGEGQPLHVPPLGAPEAQDSLLGEGVQREGVHALLVYHHKALVRTVAHLYSPENK